MSAGRCRSDCSAPVVVVLVARSASGRMWESPACADPEHQDSTRAMIAALGFEVVALRAVEGVTA